MNIYWASGLFGTGIALGVLVAAAQPVIADVGLVEEQGRSDSGFPLGGIGLDPWPSAAHPVNHRQPPDPDPEVSGTVPAPRDQTLGVTGPDESAVGERNSDKLRQRILSHDRNSLRGRGRDRGQLGSGAAGSY
jgi:hypothetical protein